MNNLIIERLIEVMAAEIIWLVPIMLISSILPLLLAIMTLIELIFILIEKAVNNLIAGNNSTNNAINIANNGIIGVNISIN